MPTFETVDLTIPELIHAEQIIIASNRGPLEYYLSQDKTLEYNQGPGGLVTALTVAANLIGATSSEERHTKARQVQQEVERHDLNDWLIRQIRDINKLLEIARCKDVNRKYIQK